MGREHPKNPTNSTINFTSIHCKRFCLYFTLQMFLLGTFSLPYLMNILCTHCIDPHSEWGSCQGLKVAKLKSLAFSVDAPLLASALTLGRMLGQGGQVQTCLWSFTLRVTEHLSDKPGNPFVEKQEQYSFLFLSETNVLIQLERKQENTKI